MNGILGSTRKMKKSELGKRNVQKGASKQKITSSAQTAYWFIKAALTINWNIYSTKESMWFSIGQLGTSLSPLWVINHDHRSWLDCTHSCISLSLFKYVTIWLRFCKPTMKFWNLFMMPAPIKYIILIVFSTKQYAWEQFPIWFCLPNLNRKKTDSTSKFSKMFFFFLL